MEEVTDGRTHDKLHPGTGEELIKIWSALAKAKNELLISISLYFYLNSKGAGTEILLI